jgi:uncharacterized surface protein with fasciclin (FAS1) repeats
LTYHVVTGNYNRENLIGVKSVISLKGSQIDLDISDDSFEANNARIIAAEIDADNGVINVIDTVMLMRPHWAYAILESGRVGVV